ncbi:ArsR/SmtB family transcription factor [Paramicrobacterium sp. CJ85]|uniref:ArsR/SmtB family transcription factor n=1 Tax=Paramicrobacterium sp. CJ85 TaxID=3445355 RepID=UPI003F62D417
MASKDPLSLVFSALADPTRREILSALHQESTTVGQIAKRFDISAPAVSQHLKVLESAGLVERTTNAQWRTLSIRTEPLDEAAAWVEKHRREWNERFDALEDHLRSMNAKEQP